ncbi:MAG: GNAT family N-acetyltransferase, partial [Chloroflexota bacterium]
MDSVEIRPLRWGEIEAAAALGAYAWPHRTPAERVADFGRRVDPEREALVAVEAGQIVSQAHIHAFGTWIEGERFSTGGFTNVVTVPERARRGNASQLLRASLAWMREELGHTLSTLYPTVFPLYNQLGWAPGEDALHLSGAPAAFRPSPRLSVDSGGRLERRLAEVADFDHLEPIYRRFATPRVGYLDHPRWYWEDYVLRQRHGAEARWLVQWHGSDHQLAAYALYAFERGVGASSSESRLVVRDLVSLRPEGYQALLSFFSAHHLWGKVVVESGRDVAWP